MLAVIEEQRSQGYFRGVTFDPQKAQIQIHIGQELQKASFAPHSTPANLGIQIPDLAKQNSQLKFAINTISTNFVRGNGFVILNEQIYLKDPSAQVLDDPRRQFKHQRMQGIQILPYPKLVDIDPKNPSGQMVISGPWLCQNGENRAKNIVFREPSAGPTLANEVNFHPFDVRTSFSAFGFNDKGMMCALSAWNFDSKTNPRPSPGWNCHEIAELLLELGFDQAILGGGSADTQQWLKDHPFLYSAPRPKSLDRFEVQGRRGLGAVLALYEQT